MKSFLDYLESDGAIAEQEIDSIKRTVGQSLARLKTLMQVSPSSRGAASKALDGFKAEIEAQLQLAGQDASMAPRAYTTNSDPWPKQAILTPPTARG